MIRRSGLPWQRAPRYRWECRCSDPPILLARYEPGGPIEIKVRNRFYYLSSGWVQAICPKCGATHLLDLRPGDGVVDDLPLLGSDPSNGWG